MAITLPRELPAYRILESEGVHVSPASVGRSAPLRIALLNLMPTKIATETQFARLLARTPFQVELTLVVPSSYMPRHTPVEHLRRFYSRWSEIRDRSFDGLIVTGAPVETLPFEAVTYWEELTRIFDWATTPRVGGAFYVCWAAQAALYHLHGVPKHPLPQKRFGVYPHRVRAPGHPLFAGFDDVFPVPVSRHTEVSVLDLPGNGALSVLADSEEAGLGLVGDDTHRALYMFNHLEYEAETLRGEYLRDVSAGRAVALPRNYFPEDDPTLPPHNGWSAYASLLFGNWLSTLSRAARPRPRSRWVRPPRREVAARRAAATSRVRTGKLCA
ncbi:MAG: homoserine O-succinyltransferase [Gammaproteobacteria bacterium]|nr:homoserine O-succinyltransferase [Gammaproteobacteria bacterium]NIR85898.1 homoserine O-succinyltransferase [Gammaproteobacteria bacterium]NIR91890.1 homoserine O-succinyltransferase [Gammaproteobacteria bacterium]NIU07147.1 homoserine O-succinyltransferase [Gammaproteobacteria bacterium]NIV53960.1 homoserine O-succinyltransferase [Gammaproteobacteria bacterium]